jgi:predicted ATP-dependent protease
MRASRRVPPSEVTVRTDPAGLPDEPARVPDRIGILPPRAATALALGLSPRNPGFHVFVACEAEVMFEPDVVQAVHKSALALPAAPDVVYVHDFDRPWAPRALTLPSGTAHTFADAVDDAMDEIEKRLGALGSSPTLHEAQTALAKELASKNKQVVSDLESFAKSLGFGIRTVPGGVQTFPILHGKPVSPEQFEVLDESTRRTLTDSEGKLTSAVDGAARRIREMTEEVNAASGDAMQVEAEKIVEQCLKKLRESYAGIESVIPWLDQVGAELVHDWADFVMPDREAQEQQEAEADEEGHGDPEIATHAGRFRVNVHVSHHDEEHAPVVYETNPTFANLFGYLERRFKLGTLVTDYMRIRAGALSKASGGYLVLRAADLLADPIIWERFKRVLRDRQLGVEDPVGPLGTYATTLRPQSVKLDLRLVLVGSPGLFEQLLAADSDFASLVRVKVEVDWRVRRDESTLRGFDGYLMDLPSVQRGGCKFDRAARARLLDFATRLAGDKELIALTPAPLEETACFASMLACARPDDAKLVTAEDVEAAWYDRRDRSASIEREMRDMALRGDLLVETSSTRIGVVNGLSVFAAGDVEFGQPMRITAVVSLGREGVIDVEREAQLGGSLHTKGLAIVRGFLSLMFGQERPLSLRVQIAFEQSYGEIDGDSASAAELFAILSALADVGIDQGLAVTGSVNQLGEIQAIGGVCAKIEGFFDLVKGRGLTGAQGVCLPRSNLRHLVLRPDVTKAIADGKFHLYGISSVSEGIEILTGLSAGARDASGRFAAGSVFGRVERRLIELAELLRSAEAGPAERAAAVETSESDGADASADFMRR